MAKANWLDEGTQEEIQSLGGGVGILTSSEGASEVSRTTSGHALSNVAEEHWGWDAAEIRSDERSDRSCIKHGREQAQDYSKQTCEALRKGIALIGRREPEKATLFLRGIKILQRRITRNLMSTKIASVFLILAFIFSVMVPLEAASTGSLVSHDDTTLTSESGEALTGTPEDFVIGVRSANLTTQTATKLITVWTEEYSIKVDYATPYVNYTINPYFTSDFLRYRRMDPYYPGNGTDDQYGNHLDNVQMTVSRWGRLGQTVWFVESCPEFSLNQTFSIFRDYFELNVTYTPGTKKVVTTYFIGLFSKTGSIYNLVDDQAGRNNRYVPGFTEKTPSSQVIGGWYPRNWMMAPACDMRVSGGSLGFEWGYSDTVAYLSSPQWMDLSNPCEGGGSVFGLKYSSINSIVPNPGVGTSEAFHMFVRPYKYTDGSQCGYDVGYAQWVAPIIASAWGNHNTPVFPLTVMDIGGWNANFKNWIEQSQVKVATYSDNPDQIDWNYKSSVRAAYEPDDPAHVPDEWEFWDKTGPAVTSDGSCIVNPVSGPYTTQNTLRWQLIQNDPQPTWWWGSKGVFWDMMDSIDIYNEPRQDYQNRAQFIYEGYLGLVKDSYSSGHWSYVISNPYTASLHLAIASDLSCVEGYEPSSTHNVDMKNHVISTMKFVNNIPAQYRPNIVVYQYYDAGNAADQEDVYSVLFGAAQYKFDVTLISYASYDSQLHNLIMAEEMFKAMGCSRDNGNGIDVGAIDLALASTMTTDSNMVVVKGSGNPSVTFTSPSDTYKMANLHATATNFDFVIPSSNYYLPGTNVQSTGAVTYRTDGKTVFHGSIPAEKTGTVVSEPDFSVNHQNSGTASVSLTELTATGAKFSVSATGGTTAVTIRGLTPGGTYGIYVDSQLVERKNTDSQGILTFSHSYDSTDNVVVQEEAASDITPPTIQSTAPANAAAGVELTQDLAITFSESMDKTATESAFSMRGDGAAIAGSVSWEAGDTKMVFSPSQVLDFNTKYFANVSTGAKDLAGNQLQSPFSISFTTKDANDTSPPTVTDVYPSSGATGVLTRPTIVVTFSEIMDVSVTSPSVHLSSSEGVADGDLHWMDMNTTAIFTPSAELFSSKTYTITVEESARDIFGNNMTSRFTSTFVTKANDTDTTRPAVQSTVPIGGLTDVEVTQNVAVFFSEKMSKTSVEAAFSMQAGGLSVGGSFSWDSQGESCIFTPYGALGYSTTYIVTIGTAARDAAGNSMASAYSFSFITKSSNDVLPPTVTDVYPSNGETGVSAYATVMLTFSEWMNNSATVNAFYLSSTSGEVSGTVQWKNKNTTMIFTPSQGLLPSTEYTVKVETSASDLVGNRMSSEFRSTFVTRNDGTDTSAPVIEHVQSGNSEVGTAFYLTANVTDVSRLASVTLVYVDVTGAYHSIAMGLGLTFFDATIPAQIAPGTVRYTIQAQDESGNAATSAEYALRVFDTTPPSIRIVSPSSGTVVSSLINIESVANDNYGISSVEFFVDGVSAVNDTVEPYVFPFNPSKSDNGSHTINLVAYDLSGMTSFASVDVSVNRLDTSPPTLTMVYPSDGMVGVNTSVDIFVAFSEEMNASSTISAISLETGGIWIELSKTWQDGCSIAADPLADLRYSTTYRLHINASAMDIAGNSLQGDLQFAFTTQSQSGGQTVSGFVTVGVIPIVGATVSDGYRTVLTDKYGNFVFPDIPSGSYSFSVAKWNYSCEQMVRVTVNNGQSVSGIKFLMTPAAGASAICGIIRDDDNSTTVMGALVTVIETSQTAFSDANGRFVVSKVIPGTYTLKIAKLLYKTNTVANVVVSQGENAEVISFNLSSTIGSASSGVTNPNAMAIGDLALPFAIGAGLAALAGGMVMRGPWRSERRQLFNRGPEESLDPANDTVLEETVLVSPMVSRESAELDQLVEVISSGGPKRSRVISELDAEGKEDFERGLKELEKLK